MWVDEFLESLKPNHISLGLERIEALCRALEIPAEGPHVIVAGTNGKGSTCAYLLAILAGAGYRVGLYTSPHLSCVRERFRLNGRLITEAEFAALASRIHGVLAGEQITYFEFTTALALLWFAEQKVDLAIMEVGMGGRLDATNVIQPLVGVITNVSMDHQAYLGHTLAEVAAEKAGIIKAGVPLVSGVAADISREVVAARCRELGAPLFLLGRDFFWHSDPATEQLEVSPGNRRDGEHARWSYQGLHTAYQGLHGNLRGLHQRDNLSLALATLELLAPRLPVAEAAVRAGLTAVKWPGRLELLNWQRPEASESGPRRLLLDGAHNPAGAATLAAALTTGFPRRKLLMVWASMADKEVAATLALVAPLCDIFIFTRPESERSATAELLIEALPPELRSRAVAAAGVEAALLKAWDLAGTDDLIVVAGSLYLVGAARRLVLGEVRDDD